MTGSTEEDSPRPTSARGPQQPVYHWDTGRRRSTVRHSAQCDSETCPTCARSERKRMATVMEFQGERKAATDRDPGDRWETAQHRLAEYARTHTVQRHRGKPETPSPRLAWIHHLDRFTLAVAIAKMETLYPLYGRIVRAYFWDNLTQAEIGQQEHLDQSAVSRKLRTSYEYLKVLYEGVEKEHSIAPDD